jgi:acetylornithine/succinyldiaminopimelate/putrescine aminotransferase
MTSQAFQDDRAHVFHSWSAQRALAPAVVAGGEGAWFWTEDGTRYLDFVAGIAVNALGYADPDFNAAVLEALEGGVIHTSNLFRTRPAAELKNWRSSPAVQCLKI